MREGLAVQRRDDVAARTASVLGHEGQRRLEEGIRRRMHVSWQPGVAEHRRGILAVVRCPHADAVQLVEVIRLIGADPGWFLVHGICSIALRRSAIDRRRTREPGSVLSDLAERGRSEDLDAGVPGGRGLDAAHVDRRGLETPALTDGYALAGVPVERLAAAGCVQAQQPGAVGA